MHTFWFWVYLLAYLLLLIVSVLFECQLDDVIVILLGKLVESCKKC